MQKTFLLVLLVMDLNQIKLILLISTFIFVLYAVRAVCSKQQEETERLHSIDDSDSDASTDAGFDSDPDDEHVSESDEEREDDSDYAE